IIEEHVAEKLAHEEPTHEEPTHEEPTHEEPTHEEPTHEEPTHEEPTHEEPTHEEPTHEEPTHEEPIAKPLAVEKPTVEEVVESHSRESITVGVTSQIIMEDDLVPQYYSGIWAPLPEFDFPTAAVVQQEPILSAKTVDEGFSEPHERGIIEGKYIS